MLPALRRPRRATLLLFLTAYAAFVVVANLALAAGQVPERRPLLTATAVVNLVGLAVVVGGVLLAYGRLRPRDLGLVPRALLPGALAVMAAWVGMQALAAASLAAGGEPLHPMPGLPPQLPAMAGVLIAQIAGNALLEEISWRGYLLRQLLAQAGRSATARRWVRDALAVLVSSITFALAHVPNRLLLGAVEPGELISQMVALSLAGFTFAAIYLASGNLWFTVGIHALANEPITVVGGAEPSAPAAVGMGLVIAAGWLFLRRVRSRLSPATGQGDDL